MLHWQHQRKHAALAASTKACCTPWRACNLLLHSDEMEEEEADGDLDGLEQEEDADMAEEGLSGEEGADEDDLDQDDLSQDDPHDDGMGIFRKALDQSAQQAQPSSAR